MLSVVENQQMPESNTLESIANALAIPQRGLVSRMLEGADEAARERVWAATNHVFRREAGKRRSDQPKEMRAAQAGCEAELVLGAGPPDALRRVGRFVVIALPTDEFHDLLRRRPEAWRKEFASALLDSWAQEREVGLLGPYWTEHWHAVRHAVRAAVLTAEPRDAYLVLMVRGLTFTGSIEQELEADSELLDSEVWEIFNPRPSVQRALVGGDSYHDAANTWGAALVRLAQRGLLDSHTLREQAARASTDSEIIVGHRRWFRRLAHLLEHPDQLPAPHGRGTPPPGNRLRGKRYAPSTER